MDRKEITGLVDVVGIELSTEELRQLVADTEGVKWCQTRLTANRHIRELGDDDGWDDLYNMPT